MSAGVIALVAVLAICGSLAYLVAYFRWEARTTRGLAYFGRAPGERHAVKRRIALYSWPAMLLLRAMSVFRHTAGMPCFRFRGVAGPPAITSPESFARATQYRPRQGDVFVATHMRSGTTWMQQLVFQVVTRGAGELGTAAAPHLYALSPWLEAHDTVTVGDAPALGAPPTRLIKTHLPAELCPDAEEARYIYVTRHPVAAFASIVDFNRTLAGPLLPSLPALVEWFCSDDMYWSPWPAHVGGWWQRAAGRGNVLFVHFEQMSRDFAAVRGRVARFVGVELTDEEAARVDARCTLAFMQAHEVDFEMARPTMFSVRGGTFLQAGGARRTEKLPEAARTRILDYCRRGLAATAYPAARFYPDLALPASGAARPTGATP